MADEHLDHSVAELEEGISLEAGKEYEITEKESVGKLSLLLKDEEGVDPLKNEDLKVTSEDGFSASGKTDADGAWEHAEPVPYGDYTVTSGNAVRVVQAGEDDSPAQVLSMGGEERADPYEAPGSDEDDPEDEEDQVPLVEIFREGGVREAPSVVDLDAKTILEAVATPNDLEGTWEWSSASSKVKVTPVEGAPHKATVEGTEETGEGEKASITAKITPTTPGYAEADVEHEVEVKRRVAEVFFQRSPGFPSGPDRGVSGLAWRVIGPGGETLQEGTSEADGKVEVRFAGHPEVTLQLLVDDAPVASYEIVDRTEDLEPVDKLLGQQRRLRMLGYHLGHGGGDQNGVDDDFGLRTDRAIQEFQADAALDTDGVPGSQTQSSLSDVAGA
jgi:hypothetical protein